MHEGVSVLAKESTRALHAKWRRDDAAIDRDGDAERRRPRRRRMRDRSDESKEEERHSARSFEHSKQALFERFAFIHFAVSSVNIIFRFVVIPAFGTFGRVPSNLANSTFTDRSGKFSNSR